MKYDYLLFDADDTLLDFKRSEGISFQIVLENNGITQKVESLYESYQQINTFLWSQHTQGLVSKEFLIVERFRKLLEMNNLKADPEKMNTDYFETLPNQIFLVDGALELLELLRTRYPHIPLVIITNGAGTVQHNRLNNSPFKSLIDLMVVSEECGFSKPDLRIFTYTFNLLKINQNSSKILMIGDNLGTDISGAHNAQIDSCWFNPHDIKNSTSITPTYEIQNILDVLKILHK